RACGAGMEARAREIGKRAIPRRIAQEIRPRHRRRHKAAHCTCAARHGGAAMSSRRSPDHHSWARRGVILATAGFIGACGLLWQPAICTAHEVRPSYLELREDRAGEFDVLLKTPMRGELRLALATTFSGRAEAVTPMTTRATGDAAVQTWRFRTLDP